MMFLFHRQWYRVLWVALFCLIAGAVLSAESYPDMVATRIWRPLSPDAHAVALFPLNGRAEEEVTGVSMEEMLELSGQRGTSETGFSAEGSGTSGDVRNTAGMGRAAELKGACKLMTAGRFRGGLQFEGKDGRLVTRGYDAHPARTVEMWLRPTNLPEEEATVFCLHDTEKGRTPISLRLLSKGGLQLVWGGKKMEPVKNAVPPAEWTHISVGWETRWPHKREVFLRVNGRTEQKLTSMNVRPALRADALVVGAAPSGKRGFAGTMDEIRFSRTLRDYYLPDHLWTKPRAEVTEPSGQPFFRDKDDLLLRLGMDSTLSASVFPDRFHAPEYEPEPGKAELPPWDSRRIFKPGVHGEALTVGKEGMNPRFSGRDFLRTKAGTLAFWLRPLDWDNFTRDNRFDDARPRSFCLFTVFGEYAKGSWERKFKKSGPIMSFRVVMNMSERVVDPVDLHPGRWVHVACTWEGAQLQYYVNGRRRSPDGAFAVHLEMRTAEDKMKTDPKWWIRAKPESLRFDWTIYQGRAPVHTLIDDFRIYRRPLAPSEISNLARLYDPREKITELPSADIEFDYNGVVGRVDAKVIPLLADYEKLAAAHLSVLKEGREAALGSKRVEPDEFGLCRSAVETPPLDFGKYNLRVRLMGPDDGFMAEKVEPFTRTEPPWWQCRAGLSEKVMPEWEQVRVEGNVMRPWGRRVSLGPSGLPERVVSAGENLLAGPIVLKASRDGEKLSLTPEGDALDVRAESEKRVHFSGGLRGEGFSVKTGGYLEFDGMMWFKLRLVPDDGAVPQVDSLQLCVPYRGTDAELVHWWSGLRNFRNPRITHIGALPEGEGVVFRSNDSENVALPDGLRGSFIPYVMLTGDERGMAWFAENDRGWTKTREEPAVTISREGERVILRLNMISERTALEKPRTFAFGLHPIPVRPLDERWRMVPGWGVIPDTFSGNNLKGRKGPTAFDMYPEDSWEAVQRRIEGEGLTKGAAGLRGRYRGGIAGFRRRYDREPHPREIRVPALYWDMQWTGNKPAHTREWAETWGLGRGDFQHYDDAFIDFASWCWDEWITETDKFIRGVYMDDCWPAPQSWESGPVAYALPDGHVQPGYQFRGYRERLERMRQICHDHEIVPHMCAHTTHTFFIPYHAFFDVILDGEDHYSKPPSQKDFIDHWSLARLRFMNNRKWGITTTWLGWHGNSLDTDKWPAWTYRQQRAYTAGLALHDIEWNFSERTIRDFGLRQPDTEFVAYWDDQPPASSEHAKLLCAGWKRKGKALLLLVNIGEERLEATVQPSLKALGLAKSSAIKVRDVDPGLLTYFDDDVTTVKKPKADEVLQEDDDLLAEPGEFTLEERPEDLPLEQRRAQDPDGKYAWEEGKLRCPVRRHDFRLFELQPKPDPDRME